MEADVVKRIVEYLERNGPANVYTLAKELGLRSYGVAVWYVEKAMRHGLVQTKKVANMRIVYLPGQDPLSAVTVRDVIHCLQRLARRNGAEPAQAIYHYLEKCL
jgi:predicted transcriptional regulator